MTLQAYDLIGDIHGHADKLISLLDKLGYKTSAKGYCHPERKVIFLGDFIDRGENLRQHQKLLEVVMTMIENGHALAVMGNHEFNALAFHTQHNGEPLRPHTSRNISQHQAFLNEFEDQPQLKQRVLDFFFSLPLWLELDGLRVIHACWDKQHIDWLAANTARQRLTPELLIEACAQGTAAYHAIETLLKGVEVGLPEGVQFNDKDGHPRTAVRVQWWDNQATTLGQVALPFGVDIGDAASLAIPDHVPSYHSDQPPCFIGHYWLHGDPAPLTTNVACLDYSVAKNGKLVAYRWSGEQILSADNFIHC